MQLRCKYTCIAQQIIVSSRHLHFGKSSNMAKIWQKMNLSQTHFSADFGYPFLDDTSKTRVRFQVLVHLNFIIEPRIYQIIIFIQYTTIMAPQMRHFILKFLVLMANRAHNVLKYFFLNAVQKPVLILELPALGTSKIHFLNKQHIRVQFSILVNAKKHTSCSTAFSESF